MSANLGNSLSKEATLQGGRYVIESTLGQGGFGITYRAIDTRLSRTVAIKELYPGGSERTGSTITLPEGYTRERWSKAVADFSREARTLSSLDHPGIVTVHDHFEENNTAYMVMRYIDGKNLMTLAREHGGRLPEAEVLRYITEVGVALGVVHAKGLLHRDIKPNNIMLDQQGHAVLIDFGATRAFIDERTLTHSVTYARGFSPPEQLLDRGRLGPTADVYALAATCYCLLSGNLPSFGDDDKPKNDRGRITPHVLKALEHGLAFNPADRPQDVSTFIAELHGRISAPPPVSKAAAQQPRRADEETDDYETEVPDVRPRPVHQSQGPRRATDVNVPRQRGRDPVVIVLGATGGALVIGLLVVVFLISANSGNTRGTNPPPVAVATTAGGQPTAVQSDSAAPVQSAPAGVPTQQPTTVPVPNPLIRTLTGHTSGVNSVAFSPDGQTLASGSNDGAIKLWSVSDGTTLRTLHDTSPVLSVALSPDGQTLASGSNDGAIKLWRVSDGSLIRTLTGHTNVVYSVAFSPDGQTLASGSNDGAIKLWKVSDGSVIRTLTGHADYVNSVAFSPDGQTLASGSEDHTIKLWRVSDGTTLRTLQDSSPVLSVVFSPDGQTLASGSYREIKLWRVSDGTTLRTLTGHTSWVVSVEFSSDGQTLASGSLDSTVKLWRVH